MTVFSVIYAIAFLVYLALVVLIVARNPRAVLNWFCALLLFCFALWAFEDIFHHLKPLIPMAQACAVGKIGTTGAFGFASAFLLFALALTNRQKYLRSWLLYVPVIGVPLVFIIAQWTGLAVIHLKPGRFGWVVDWTLSLWISIYVAYFLSVSILGLYVVAHYGRAATQLRQRRQANVVFVTALATLVLGVANDIVLDALTHGSVPELAGTFGLIWGVGLAISMTRYGLTTFTVQAAADKILATMPDGLLLLDPAGNIVTVNRATQDQFGFRTQDLIGKPAASLFDRPGDFEAALRRLLSDGSLAGIEVSGRTRAGRAFPAAVTARTMPRTDGSVRGSVWVLRDITELKRAENEIRAKSERLELLNRDLDDERRKLLALAEELTRANADLKRLSDAKSEFVAAASHDLRTPLTTIVEGIRLVEEGSLGSLNDEQRQFLGYAREDALRLGKLIGSVLDVAKIERGKMQVRKARVDVAEIVERIRTTYGNYARDKGLAFAAELPPVKPYVFCDESHYHRVLANLVSNAIKFTPSGGSVAVRVDSGNGRGSSSPIGPLPPQPLGPALVITSVTDTGVGIPEDQHHRIFQKFEQIAQTGTVVRGGTGLGLALCKQLVELNGGTIGFESTEGQGSIFFFELPGFRDQPTVSARPEGTPSACSLPAQPVEPMERTNDGKANSGSR